uniref:Rab-GAP TBC domain-containing protein n=1 Tax=Clastoptera arizonana TaxID=38151 RepID=A0A1B6DKW6_9HEMI
MTNILFCYAREYPTMCYRQGMHEILAPLLFILHCDHQALLHTKELDFVSEIIDEALNERYFEEDSYVMFEKVMAAIQGSYHINDLTPSSTGYFPTQMSPTHSPISENQVLTQLEWIKEKLFAPNDPELFQHLVKLDISLPLFGIRWLRLLFGREFPLQDLLVLWDAIFSEGTKFHLVNYIVVAMLKAIRHQLLSSDYTDCLTLLMHYPTIMDISYIIDTALHLKDPKAFSKPTMTPFPQFPSPSHPEGRIIKETNKPPDKGKKPLRIPNSTSQVNLRTKKTSKQTLGRNAQANMSVSDSLVIDGYRLDDPALVRGELQHAHAVMSLCRLKLAQYYSVLEKYISEDNIPAQQALTGIHEVNIKLSKTISVIEVKTYPFMHEESN